MEIIKYLEIDVGHRLLGHESKCKNIHGHRLKFGIHASSARLDSVGRVVDFSVIKEVIGGWLNDNLDHGFICNPKDPFIQYLMDYEQKWFCMQFPFTDYIFGGNREIFPLWIEPSSENLARMVLEQCALFESEGKLLGATVGQVDCHETPTAFASYTLNDLLIEFSLKNQAGSSGLPQPWFTSFLLRRKERLEGIDLVKHK